MKYLVTINGERLEASTVPTKGRYGFQDVVFRPESKPGATRKNKPKYRRRAVIEKITVLRGGGMGPFGSPLRETKMYNIEGWGKVEWIGQREFDFLAKRFNEAVTD